MCVCVFQFYNKENVNSDVESLLHGLPKFDMESVKSAFAVDPDDVIDDLNITGEESIGAR